MSWQLSNGTEEFRDEELRHALAGSDEREAEPADDVQMVECPCCNALFPVFHRLDGCA